MTVSKKIILILIVIIALVIVLFGQENYETGKIIENYLSASGNSALAEVKTEIRKGTVLRGITGEIPVATIAQSCDQQRSHRRNLLSFIHTAMNRRDWLWPL